MLSVHQDSSFCWKTFKQSLCSIFLIFLQRFDQVLIFNANSHCLRIGINWRHNYVITTTITTVLRHFFRDHPGEPVSEENFWTLWRKGRLTEANTQTIRLGATPSGLTSAHLHLPPPFFLQAGCPSCRPTNSDVKALKETSAFRLGRRR